MAHSHPSLESDKMRQRGNKELQKGRALGDSTVLRNEHLQMMKVYQQKAADIEYCHKKDVTNDENDENDESLEHPEKELSTTPEDAKGALENDVKRHRTPEYKQNDSYLQKEQHIRNALRFFEKAVQMSTTASQDASAHKNTAVALYELNTLTDSGDTETLLEQMRMLIFHWSRAIAQGQDAQCDDNWLNDVYERYSKCLSGALDLLGTYDPRVAVSKIERLMKVMVEDNFRFKCQHKMSSILVEASFIEIEKYQFGEALGYIQESVFFLAEAKSRAIKKRDQRLIKALEERVHSAQTQASCMQIIRKADEVLKDIMDTTKASGDAEVTARALDEVIDWYTRAIQMSEHVHPDTAAEAYNRLGHVYKDILKQEVRAQTYYKQSWKMAERSRQIQDENEVSTITLPSIEEGSLINRRTGGYSTDHHTIKQKQKQHLQHEQQQQQTKNQNQQFELQKQRQQEQQQAQQQSMQQKDRQGLHLEQQNQQKQIEKQQQHEQDQSEQQQQSPQQDMLQKQQEQQQQKQQKQHKEQNKQQQQNIQHKQQHQKQHMQNQDQLLQKQQDTKQHHKQQQHPENEMQQQQTQQQHHKQQQQPENEMQKHCQTQQQQQWQQQKRKHKNYNDRQQDEQHYNEHGYENAEQLYGKQNEKNRDMKEAKRLTRREEVCLTRQQEDQQQTVKSNDEREQCVRDEKQHDYEPHHGQLNVHHYNDEQRKRRRQQNAKHDDERRNTEEQEMCDVEADLHRIHEHYKEKRDLRTLLETVCHRYPHKHRIEQQFSSHKVLKTPEQDLRVITFEIYDCYRPDKQTDTGPVWHKTCRVIRNVLDEIGGIEHAKNPSLRRIAEKPSLRRISIRDTVSFMCCRRPNDGSNSTKM